MRILVTGGAGFIGSHVCERLLELRHEVSVVDDLNDFYSPELKRENLAVLHSTGPVQFHCCDICDEDKVFGIISGYRPEAIIHLAARAGVRPSLEQPLLYERVNVRGTLVLLEASRRLGVRKFIFASSSSVYGVTNRVPFRESDPVTLPISPYAATKIAAEKICYTYSYLYGLKVVCLRFFTVYGPRQRPDLAIRKFTELIDRGQPVPVYGEGSASRDFTFIDDLAPSVVAALSHDCDYDVINLGSSHPVDVRSVIQMIEDALGRKANIVHLPPQSGDVPLTYADISKAERVLGHSPQTEPAEGIRRFVDWYRDWKQGNTARRRWVWEAGAANRAFKVG